MIKVVEIFKDGEFDGRVLVRFTSNVYGPFLQKVHRDDIRDGGLINFSVPGERHMIRDTLSRPDLKKIWRALNEQALRSLGS